MSKRARVHELSTSESDLDHDLDVPSYSKAPHLDPSASGAPLFCSLAPTCNITPTPLANTRELEAHYARAHAHVCAAQGCVKVFPDARLLQLHHTECHDTLATMRKERGEKIFACHVASCPKLCATPKSRRMHLIEAHGYPKEYFFAVTNKGIGGLLQRWGDGATMLRGEWKPREGQQGWREDAKDDSDDDSPGGNKATETDAIAGASKAQRSVRFRSPTSPGLPPASSPPTMSEPSPSLGDGVDALARELSNMSVSLVPRGVRFGRGGARGGFANGQNSQGHVQQGANKGKNGRPAPAPAPTLEPGAVTIQTRAAAEKAGANTKANGDNARGKDKAAGSNISPSAQTQGGKTGNTAKAKGPGPKSPPKANSKPAIPAPAPATATSPPAAPATELDAMEEDASDAEPNGMSPEPGEDGEKKRTRRTNRGGRGRARRKKAAQGATGSSEAGVAADAMQE